MEKTLAALNGKDVFPAAKAALARVLRAKERRRRALARLPIERKVRLVLELQKTTNEIRRRCGRPVMPEWRI